MSLRLGALHDALLDPGNQEKAMKAAEEVARYEAVTAGLKTEWRVLQALVGLVGALVLGNLWLSLNILSRLSQ